MSTDAHTHGPDCGHQACTCNKCGADGSTCTCENCTCQNCECESCKH